MTRRSSISVDVLLDLSHEDAWTAVTDWPSQSDWVFATTVRNTANGGVGVGGGLEAFSGFGRIGVLDTMVITEWEPPRRVVVEHTGSVVRGIGVFEVFALPGGRSRFVWSEELELPLGVVGRSSWPLVRPFFALGVGRSLQKFKRLAEADQELRQR